MTNTKECAEDTCSLVYQCRLPLSTRTVNHLAGLLRRHLKAIRSRWRILPPGRIAVIVLAVLRHDHRLTDMAGGSNVSESTARRWRDELIVLLATQAPRLDRALKEVAEQGGEMVLIDGTLIPTQRRTGKADRRNYSGKHHHHPSSSRAGGARARPGLPSPFDAGPVGSPARRNRSPRRRVAGRGDGRGAAAHRVIACLHL
ncbi:hypothetical protein [Streptomyces sp. PSKA30]|uniref:hypothetical protein n=1 Tax=Streptomyces sp. PSKA30 TaxID=2874597 RepID=UPI001CD10C45|nr:hypothetical protein [Streptomyces sp. PSKA30]MBZ9643703.1 hypothetical protein [Streptomyces sp. PSKA30]